MTNDSDNRWLIPLLLAAGAGLALWYFLIEVEKPLPVETEPQEPAETAAPRLGPIHPLEPDSPDAGDRELVPLPPLADSDAYFKLALLELVDRDLDRLLVRDALIEKVVATIDNLPRSRVAERLRPVGTLTEAFVAEPGGDRASFVLGPDNFRRYDELVDMLNATDLDALVETYRRFYPLFQEAYVSLGYPNGYFNDRVVEVIDHLLETPEPGEPVRLVRPNVLYEFADMELESRSAGQKLLLRMGPQHTRQVKAVLNEIRGRITTQ
ncbi:MAG: DUF3014 domain-containing protein [Woeseiaceae bacterium]|nr:DUF3014 domain-containing protein [Woeseiaceae bacterium]